MLDYTLVVGLDKKHLRQFSMVWPTWMRHKPSLGERPLLVFMNEGVCHSDITDIVGFHSDLRTVPWPPNGVFYLGDTGSKFYHPQRRKMLSGFVHVPAQYVRTKYWLKIDTDTVAVGQDDWIDECWFEGNPAIIAHPWGFTKPPNQMVELDQWVDKNRDCMDGLILEQPPLGIRPKEGSGRVSHRRIISWCGFFNTCFTSHIAAIAEKVEGRGQLPVPSQDGFMWYMAKRSQQGIVRANMKSRGWQHWSTMRNVEQYSRRALQ